jgi:hypothetical protein
MECGVWGMDPRVKPEDDDGEGGGWLRSGRLVIANGR